MRKQLLAGTSPGSTVAASEAPEDLPYSVRAAASPHDFGRWFNALLERLATSGGSSPKPALIRVQYASFNAAFQRFRIKWNFPPKVKLLGAYAFVIDGQLNVGAFREIEISSIDNSVQVPPTKAGDSVLILFSVACDDRQLLASTSNLAQAVSLEVVP